MKKFRYQCISICMILFSTLFVCGCSIPLPNSTEQSAAFTPSSATANLYFFDVGQGDSTLIRLPSGATALIDAGPKSAADTLVNNLEKLGIQKIDLLIATHPHADHIGGMQRIVQNFEIGEIYMPKIADNQIPTTAAYTNFLKAVESKGLKINQAKAGTVIYQTENTTLELLAPNSASYSNLNNYSVVTKLTYGNVRFLFTGDAEKESETELLQNNYDLSCEVLKVGHHGSNTSTSNRFLTAATPKTAVISCGQGNDYGHPHAELLKRLSSSNINVYRTDTGGTIAIETDGSTYTVTENALDTTKKAA